MSAAIIPAPPADEIRRKRFTRAEVDRLEEIGFFNGHRYELIDGELIDKMGQNPPHARAITKVFSQLLKLFAPEQLRIQVPLEAAAADQNLNLPEPDVAVMSNTGEEHGARHPGGPEALLVVEIADSSVRLDLTIKRTLYARAAVPEYWVLNIPARRLIVHRNPANGEYAEVLSFAEGESTTCAACPGLPIAVQDLLP